jgi:acyl-CoA synthetase (AMP-forming)/AMP-acid ligase II
LEFDLPHVHEAIAAIVPDRECVIWRDRRLSWRDVTDRTRRLGNLLHREGLGLRSDPEGSAPWESPHDHLALYLHNCPEYLEGVLGAHKARVAPFNVNYRYTSDELAYLLADARPRAVLYHARFAATIAQVRGRLGNDVLLLQVDDDSGQALLPGALDYEEALAGASPEPPAVDPSPDDLHIVYTGGTTGRPKGVLWRQGDYLAGPLGLRRRDGSVLRSLDEVVERAARHTDLRVLPAPPLAHGSGSWFALGGWMAGATAVIQDVTDHLDVSDVLRVCQREQVTGMIMVGDAFARPLVEELKRHRHNRSSLRVLLNAGAGLRPELRAELCSLLPDVALMDTVGSSETGPQATRRGPETASFQPGPDVAVLSGDMSRLLAPGEDEVGWLAKTGAIPRGYLGDPEKTTGTFVAVGEARYAVAGDRVALRSDGTVDLLGRDATTINTGGEKVFSEEVEAVVRAIPGVVDAVVVGRPSDRWGQEVVALVELGVERTPSDDDLRTACAVRLAGYKIPKAFLRVSRVQRGANGKADYTWARATASGFGARP